MVELIVAKDKEEISKKASTIIINSIKSRPDLKICFATGKSVIPLYSDLVKNYRKKKVNFSKVVSFNLDEYYKIKKNNKESFYYFMDKNLFSKVNLTKQNIHFLNGETNNYKKECKNYEKLFLKNKVDITILGIGENGHIAFNEPGSSIYSRTRAVKLTENTLVRNFKGKSQVYKYALTVGIKTILSSKKIILIAFGKDKVQAIKKMIKGKISKNCPASYLQKHKNVIVIIDKTIAKNL